MISILVGDRVELKDGTVVVVTRLPVFEVETDRGVISSTEIKRVMPTRPGYHMYFDSDGSVCQCKAPSQSR